MNGKDEAIMDYPYDDGGLAAVLRPSTFVRDVRRSFYVAYAVLVTLLFGLFAACYLTGNLDLHGTARLAPSIASTR